MRVIFSRHALLKMEQRNIPRHAVVAAVRFPDLRRPTYKTREEVYKRVRAIYLKVVIKQTAETIRVITAHLVAKVKNQ